MMAAEGQEEQTTNRCKKDCKVYNYTDCNHQSTINCRRIVF